MMSPNAVEGLSSRNLLDVLIRAGLIAVLAIFCYDVFRPFLDLMLASVILAVTLYPARRCSNPDGSDGPRRDRGRTARHRNNARAAHLVGISVAESAEHAWR
jgi:hypothetical protein